MGEKWKGIRTLIAGYMLRSRVRKPAPDGVQEGVMTVVCVAAQPVGFGGCALWLRKGKVGRVKRAHRRLEPGLQAGHLNTARIQS
jgi:hypothetical protein